MLSHTYACHLTHTHALSHTNPCVNIHRESGESYQQIGSKRASVCILADFSTRGSSSSLDSSDQPKRELDTSSDQVLITESVNVKTVVTIIKYKIES